ncbi:kinase-like domain-containing protein, partial [Apiospora arundinis]
RHSQDLEEGGDAYRPGGFHPVYICDVYSAKYEILSKLGYGRYATVWLVRDLEAQESDPNEFHVLKVLSAECYGSEKDILEREILRHLREGDQRLLGCSHICRLVDGFEHTGPNGKHVCLVFELYGETFRSFGTWFLESMIPGQVMRRITIQLLLALDYAHYVNVIHTGKSLTLFPHTLSTRCSNLFHYPPDIQPNNIFVKVRTHKFIRSGYLSIPPIQQDKAEKRYTVVPSRLMYRYYFEDGDRFDLFGFFSHPLLEKGDQDLVGRVFDDQGNVKGRTPFVDRPNLTHEEFTPGLTQEERDEFVAFLRSSMTIDPAKRPSPEDLLRGPWLRAPS